MPERKLKKILLVEDEEDIRTIAAISLESIGQFTVKYCASGMEALEVAESFAPDLILLDVMMPGMDGIETMKRLRLIPSLKDTPVIFLTAKVQATEISKYFKLGAIHVIAKPFEPLTLAATLNAVWLEFIGVDVKQSAPE